MGRTALTRYTCFIIALTSFAVYASAAAAQDNASLAGRMPIRFVVVTTFDTGDDATAPGELNTWVVNFPLPVILPFPQGYHHLRYNPVKQVLGIETGER